MIKKSILLTLLKPESSELKEKYKNGKYFKLHSRPINTLIHSHASTHKKIILQLAQNNDILNTADLNLKQPPHFPLQERYFYNRVTAAPTRTNVRSRKTNRESTSLQMWKTSRQYRTKSSPKWQSNRKPTKSKNKETLFHRSCNLEGR